MEVNLSEVEVTAQSVVQKPDRYIIIPTEKELKQATNGLSLLSDVQYKMPGLMVNESLQTVKVDHVTPVFKMNGKLCSLSQFLALNPQRILRIEYQENPDVKYDNRRVINVILHPGGDGGSVVTQMHGGVCANFLNGMVGVGYYNRKSEWEFSYNTNWRDYDEREISSSSLFIGRKSPVVRERSGIQVNSIIGTISSLWGIPICLILVRFWLLKLVWRLKISIWVRIPGLDNSIWVIGLNTQMR